MTFFTLWITQTIVIGISHYIFHLCMYSKKYNTPLYIRSFSCVDAKRTPLKWTLKVWSRLYAGCNGANTTLCQNHVLTKYCYNKNFEELYCYFFFLLLLFCLLIVFWTIFRKSFRVRFFFYSSCYNIILL
jgi:hypothetical protein